MKKEAISRLLGKDYSIEALPRGKNNKTYLLRFFDASPPLFLKQYYQSKKDHRARLRSEFGFLKFLELALIKNVPQAICFDEQEQFALYSFIPGRAVLPTQVRELLPQALDFFLKLNAKRFLEAAQKLPKAADACFSLEEHLFSVERRVEALLAFPELDLEDALAKAFVKAHLVPRFLLEKEKLIGRSDYTRLLEKEECCLSPSDFGFHNALLVDKQLYFLDFEYAGFDDPAKMLADFFSQVERRPPLAFFEHFLAAALQDYGRDCQERARLILPLHRLKWICIVLNNFLPCSKARRLFSSETKKEAYLKEKQLAFAKRLMAEEEASEAFALRR